MKYRILVCWVTLIVILIAVPLLVADDEKPAKPVTTVNDVLQSFVDALGGNAALEELTTRVVKGKETTDLKSREWPSYEVKWFEGYARTPNSCYLATGSYGLSNASGFDGKIGWAKDQCGVKPDDRAGKDRLAWILNPQNALRINDYWPNLTYDGTQKVRGMMVYVLNSPEMHRPMFFDSATRLLVGFGHNFEIYDYREVDGVMFPHRIVLSRKGGSTTYEFGEVRHNAEISDTLFAMPTKGD